MAELIYFFMLSNYNHNKPYKLTRGDQLLDRLADPVYGLNDFRLEDVVGDEDHRRKAPFVRKIVPKPICIHSEQKTI